jgi:SAM-dependent methyltransferase
MRKIKLLKSWAQGSRVLEKHIKQKAADGVPLRILEAGCGQNWPLDLKEIQFTLTGNDVDGDMLLLRKAKHNDLDEMIVGDLRFLDLEKHTYDVIYNSYVLEHIDGAEGVMENFSNWLKPGGLLILRIPDRNSVRGFVARNTPFWFHVFYVKHVLGFKDAGTTGVGPFRAFYDPIVSRAGIHEFCRKNGFNIKEEYGHGSHLESNSFRDILIFLFVRTVSLLSLGKLAWDHTDITYVLEKEQKPCLTELSSTERERLPESSLS